MVKNTIDFVGQFIHNSLQKSGTIISPTQQFMTNTSFDKTHLTLLMAQPFEVINTTTSTNNGTNDSTKSSTKT